MYLIIKLFLLLIVFNFPVYSQNYFEQYSCTETNLFKIYSDGFSYEKNLSNKYHFNLTNSHLIFIDGSPGSKNYIKLPIKNRNGEYLKIIQDNINLNIQFGPEQSFEESKKTYYLKYSHNDISYSEMSFSECQIIK
tara:strand:+ start:182 stop:589 length:408 start_codon:yes stop_codon:yes gene_type:complete